MFPPDLPKLTGSRLQKFMAIVKNAPRDPSCGCVKLGETARMIIDALFREEQNLIEMEIRDGKTKTEGEP